MCNIFITHKDNAGREKISHVQAQSYPIKFKEDQGDISYTNTPLPNSHFEV